MKKVLWFSRHELNEDQLHGLARVAEDGVKVTTINETVSSAAQVADLGRDFDILAVVLPTDLLAGLMEILPPGKMVVVAKNKRVLLKNPDGTEDKVKFIYDGWDVIDELKFVHHIIK